MQFERFGARVVIAALFLGLSCVGCVSSRTIARHALEAPNRQFKEPKQLQRVLLVATNFPVQRVSVGPPPGRSGIDDD